MNARTLLLGIFLCFVLSSACAADNPEAAEGLPGTLFISSSPINAFCSIDGVRVEEKTPLLLRGLAEGEHLITLEKKGHKTVAIPYTVGPGAIGIIEEDLPAFSFMSFFPDSDTIIFNRTDVYREGVVLRLPDGTYSIRQDKETIKLDPVYPKQGLLTALHFSVPTLGLVSALLTVNDITNQNSFPFFFSPATITSYILTAGALSFDLALLAQKKRFVESFPVKPVQREHTDYIAGEYFSRGEELLVRQQLREALNYYMKIVENHKESIFYPRALYKIGRIHNILGNYTLAKAEFLLLRRKYPLPELYDKTCKNLADLYVRQNMYGKSIIQLEEMLFVDPFYSRENIDLYACEIRELWYEEDESRLDDVIEGYKKMTQIYSGSENINLYRARLAYFLFLSGSVGKAEEIYNRISDPNSDARFEIEIRLELLREEGLLKK